MITPREMLRDYMTVLNLLMQNKELSFEEIIGKAVTLKTEADDASDDNNIDEKKEFSLDDIVF